MATTQTGTSEPTPSDDVEPSASRASASGSASARARAPRRKGGLFRYAVSDFGRASRITAVLIKHGFGQLFGIGNAAQEELTAEELARDPKGTARRLRNVLEELGPTFVKLGQVLSTRPDILPPIYIEELSRLQDNSPPLEFEVVEAQLEEVLGRPLEDAFDYFEKGELATGSIAQTHLARTADGQDVVVKVQRPGLHEIIRSDIDLLKLGARMLEATIEEMGLYRPTDIVDEFERALQSELDFRNEGAHLELFSELCEERDEIWVPDVIECHRTVLVMERIPGVKITEIEPETPRAQKIAKNLLDLSYSMLFEYGAFHGDPHPGNILITADDRIGLIDFGLIGRLSAQQQDVLVALIIAVVAGDIDGIARAVMQLGRPMGRVPLRQMRDDIADIRARYLRSSLGDVDMSQFVLELLEAGQKYRIRVPADYAILTKASVSMEGIVRRLYPSIDIPTTLAPYSRKLLLARYGPNRLSQQLLTGALGFSGMMRELPVQLNQLLMDLEYEGLRVTVESEPLNDLRRSINMLGTKIAFGTLSAGLWVGFFVLYAVRDGAVGTAGWVVASIAGLMVFAILFWHLIDGKVRKVRIAPWIKLVKRSRGEPPLK